MPKTEAQKAKRREKRKALKLAAKTASNAPSSSSTSKKSKKKRSKGVTPSIKGSGDYRSDSSAGKWLSKLGGLGGDFVSHLFGSGDYHDKIQANTLMDSGGPPQFVKSNTANHGIRQLHREYIGEVGGSVGFNIFGTYAINPTNSQLFPWFSTVAACFEQYRIHGMVFYFSSETGSSSAASSTLGSVIISTQYDVNELPFTSKMQMENYEYTKSAKPSESFMHGLECAKDSVAAPLMWMNNNERSGVVYDPRLSVFGNTTVATVGMPNNNVVGELWVAFDIELIKPRMAPAIASAYEAVCNGGTTGKATITPFGTSGDAAVFIYSTTSGGPGVFYGMSSVQINATSVGATIPGFYRDGIVFPSSFQGHNLEIVCYSVGTTFSTNSTMTSATTDCVIGTIASAGSALQNATTFVVQFLPLRTGVGNYVTTLNAPVSATLTSFSCTIYVRN